MARLALAALLSLASAANISDAFLGTWTPVNGSTAHSPMGPSGLFSHFTMSKDESNGDYWFSAIQGQVFRVRGDVMQYCFAHVATSPFNLTSATANKLVFCYELGHRMPSHKAMADGTLATGCDAAQISLEIHSNGNLEFTFMMSPPAKHAWLVLEKTGAPPAIETYIKANLGGACDPRNPGRPTLASVPDGLSSMCPVSPKKGSQQDSAAKPGETDCRQLDSGSWQGDYPSERVDVRLEYTIPAAPCWPCNVSYSVSAAISEEQYVSLGFKGMAYRDPGSRRHERPAYFGMATDELDESRTGRAIVLGYAGAASSCVREMKVEDYVGTPVDVPGNPHLHNASVERRNGRTVVRFVVEQHVGRTELGIGAFFSGEQVSARVMWAIGAVDSAPPAKSFVCSICAHVYDAEADGGGVAFEDLPETWTCPVCGQPKSVYKPSAELGECREALKYHGATRGVSPLAWFNQNPRCKTGAIVV